MQSTEFNEIIESEIIKIQQTLLRKGKEYAPGDETDRLINFRRAAHLQGINMKQALLGMLTKHTVSVADMIGSGKDYPQSAWDEKIGDVLVYMLLLQAVVWEEKNEQYASENASDAEPELSERERIQQDLDKLQPETLAHLDKILSAKTDDPATDVDLDHNKFVTAGLPFTPGA